MTDGTLWSADGETVATSFARPCLACGSTVHIVNTAPQPHDCQPAPTVAQLIAHAYWSGHDEALSAMRSIRDTMQREHDLGRVALGGYLILLDRALAETRP